MVLAMTAVGSAQEQVFPLDPGAAPPAGRPADETSRLWFVELASPPTADGSSLSTVTSEQAAFRLNAKKAGLVYKERYGFGTLWNGLSVEVGSSQLGKLERIPGVKALYPVVTISLPGPEANPAPDLSTALAMTGADVAQSELGYTGDGVKVAVVDTGVDYDHPDLGGCFGPGCRVVKGWDFVGDTFNADPSSLAYNPTPAPDSDPDDCNGHGTHVSGIVGANGAIKGVAPRVTFGAYRVFGCAGSTTADIMIAAMERALADGMQVLNMSIGSAFQWPQYPTAQAADRLVNKGVSVVASIGNSGANGLYSAGAPGLGKKVIGVASFDNTHVNLASFTISADNSRIGYTNATAAPPAPLSGTYAMARTGTPTTTNDACNAVAPAPGSLTGKVVLIRRGTCSFYEKSFNAMSAGAIGVVLYNNSAGRFNPTVAGTPSITIPVVAVSDTEGVLINNRLVAGPVDMTWTDQALTAVNPTGGLISSFSSYGLSPDLSLKPDIGAPGGSIRSTYPLELGGYANISGTSMASPHTAGAVALLLEAHPHTPSNAVRSILQNSADPKVWWGNPSLGFLDNVHRQGAGMLAIDDAIRATTKIEPSKLSLGEGQAGPSTHTLTVENNGAFSITYDLSYANALSTGGVITPSFSTSNASVSFSVSSLTVLAGGTATVDVTVIPATTPANGQYGGYIVFTPQGGGEVYRVPFAGFVGDYQGIQVLTPLGTPSLPWLAKLTGCVPAALLRGLDCFGTGSYSGQPLGATYTLADASSTPYVLVHLEHQVRRLRMEVFDATTGKAWHRAHDLEYHGRNSTSTGFFAYAWDGTTTSGGKTYTVPDGQYVIRMSVLKALGNDANPAHWETWTSPVITIDRP